MSKEMMVPQGEGATVARLLEAAVEKGLGVESLEKLVALQERIMDRNAINEFSDAMAEFQRRCPPIPKTRKANIATKSGASYSYTFADLATIQRVVSPILGELGLSWTWDSSVDEKGILCCVCVLRHRNGHNVRATFSCPIGDGGRMSAAQEGGAALTYARRQSLVQVLGLTTCDPDDDGAVEPAGPVVTVTEDQAANLQALLEEVGADKVKFLKWLGVPTLGQCPASKYAAAVRMLEQKRRSS